MKISTIQTIRNERTPGQSCAVASAYGIQIEATPEGYTYYHPTTGLSLEAYEAAEDCAEASLPFTRWRYAHRWHGLTAQGTRNFGVSQIARVFDVEPVWRHS